MDLDKVIQERKSVRHYSEKKPDWRHIIECIDAARYAPTAGNLFPIRFIIVSDKDKIQKLADASQQPFIASAPYVVVVCTDPTIVLNAYTEFADKFCRQQAGAAIQNFLLKAEEKNLKTCWIGYFVEYLIRNALNIPDNITIEAIFPIGLESKKVGTTEKRKRKTDMDRILYFDKWKNKHMKKADSINV